MVPSSVANRKCVGLPPIAKSDVPLNTIPVGFPPGVPSHWGMWTTNPFLFPAPSYKVDSPFPLSETHQGLPALAAKPHGLTRSVSGFVVGLGLVPKLTMSEPIPIQPQIPTLI